MRILLVGSGGREHALAQALAASPTCRDLHCAPGNPGIARIATCHEIAVDDVGGLVALAHHLEVGLVVVGPELPLVLGLGDALRRARIAVFGPSSGAARVEGSKTFSKELMQAAGVPTARAVTCTDVESARRAVDDLGGACVVKADGLAAGKGVVVTHDRSIAQAHADACGRVVIEEYLDGPEVSLFCVTDGTSVVPLVPAQDFKRIDDGDVGPNTGGMGAYAPLSWLPDDFTGAVVRSIAQPTIDEMARLGTPFAGLLYIGLAVTAAGARVVEFNARFGDPETQVVLALLESPITDLLTWAAIGGAPPEPVWRDGSAVTVVVAAAGYPGTPRTGEVLTGADQPGVIHAGTRRRDDGAVVSAGGRVLSCTATGPSLQDARDAAYRIVASVHLDGAKWRTDIAQRALDGAIKV